MHSIRKSQRLYLQNISRIQQLLSATTLVWVTIISHLNHCISFLTSLLTSTFACGLSLTYQPRFPYHPRNHPGSKPHNGSIKLRVKTKLLIMPRESCTIYPTPTSRVHMSLTQYPLSFPLPPFQPSGFLAGPWVFQACSQHRAFAVAVPSKLKDSLCLHNYLFGQHLHLYQVLLVVSSCWSLSCLYY